MRTPQSELKYFLYARKSTESEDRQAASIEDQTSEMKRLAEHLGIEIVDVITESRSAKKPNNRPEFSKMIERIYAGEANAILCWKLNRLARNPVDGGVVSWALQQGIVKHIQTFGGDFHPDDNVILMQVEFGMANQYVKDLSVDTKRGMRKKAERGWYPAGVLPAGYEHHPSMSNTGEDEIVLNDDFPLVKNLWSKLLTGRYTIADIKREGDKIGLCNRKGQKYSKNNYYAMFANEFYTGWFYWVDENDIHQRIHGKHKAMITEEEFRKVRIFLGNQGGKNRLVRYTFPFRGKMLCGECNRMITAEQKVQVRCTSCRHKFSIKHTNVCPQCDTVLQDMNNPHIVDRTYYVCVGATKKVCSQRGAVEQGELTRQIEHILQDVSIPKSFHDWAVDAVEYVTEKDAVEDGATLNVMRNRESDLEQQLSEVTIMRARQEITPTHFSKTMARIEKDLVDIRGEIAKLHKDKIDWGHIANQYLTFAETAQDRFKNGDIATRKLILECISPNLLLKDKKLSAVIPKPLLGVRSTFNVLSTEVLGLEPEKALTGRGLFQRIEPSNPIGLRDQDSNLGHPR